jgi:hypothetical protein
VDGAIIPFYLAPFAKPAHSHFSAATLALAAVISAERDEYSS